MHDSPFDSSEQAVLANSDFFLTKAAIDAKINALFGELKTEIEDEMESVADLLPFGFPRSGGRIYRGEHHGPFPWRAVDCPAGFEKQGFLSFRTLLLWGHHFSFHLILSGKWLETSLERICDNLPALAGAHLQLSLSPSIWDWEFNEETHLPLQRCSPARLRAQVTERGELKLSRLHPLEAAGSLVSTGLETWRTIQNQLFLLPASESSI